MNATSSSTSLKPDPPPATSAEPEPPMSQDDEDVENPAQGPDPDNSNATPLHQHQHPPPKAKKRRNSLLIITGLVLLIVLVVVLASVFSSRHAQAYKAQQQANQQARASAEAAKKEESIANDGSDFGHSSASTTDSPSSEPTLLFSIPWPNITADNSNTTDDDDDEPSLQPPSSEPTLLFSVPWPTITTDNPTTDDDPTLLTSEAPSLQPSSGDPTDEDEDNDKPTVILDALIIGAGWAGLAAGDTLRQEGGKDMDSIIRFEVLEARDSVGGRSRTIYNFTNDLAIELGSAWTYDNTVVHDMVERYNIPFGRINYDLDRTFGLYESGSFRRSNTTTAPAGELSRSERSRLIDNDWRNGFVPYSREQTSRLGDDDKPFQEILEAYIQDQGFDAQEDSKRRQFLQAMVHSNIEVEYGAPLDEISARDVGDSVNECIFCGANYYIPVQGGGFDKILAVLADPLLRDNNIRLEHKVTKVEYGDDDQPVRVTYFDESTGTVQTKLAQTVLVTVPLGVLKANSIEFVPSLPQSKQDAIEILGMGVLNKCIFYWEDEAQASSWWPDGKEWMQLITDQDATSGAWTTFFNDKELGNGGHFVLSAWTGGGPAMAIEQESDEAIVAQVLSNLREMLGEEVPEPSKYVISRWGQDEFARGSYSFPPLGRRRQAEDAHRELGERVQRRLFWAGEATSTDWYGTTVGAYETGVSAANEILSFLRRRRRGR